MELFALMAFAAGALILGGTLAISLFTAIASRQKRAGSLDGPDRFESFLHRSLFTVGMLIAAVFFLIGLQSLSPGLL